MELSMSLSLLEKTLSLLVLGMKSGARVVNVYSILPVILGADELPSLEFPLCQGRFFSCADFPRGIKL